MSKLSSFVLTVVGMSFISVLLFICAGGNLAAVFAAFAMFLLMAGHYLVWGAWLGKKLRREAAEEERAGSKPPG